MMKRDDFSRLSSFLCEALDYLDDSQPALAKATLVRTVEWLDEQQPRGNPFLKGEDSRRKDPLKEKQ